MDPALLTAARALASGDVLSALRLVSLRDDAPALALRGVAMAQLGELDRAKQLLQRARKAFKPRESLPRARVVLAETEVALALRELSVSTRALVQAGEVLRAAGDAHNAVFAGVLEVQQLLLSGKLREAEARLDQLELARGSAATVARAALLRFELAARRLDSKQAEAALQRAAKAASRAKIPSLLREVEASTAALARPLARGAVAGQDAPLRLHEVERLLSSSTLVVDAFKRRIRDVQHSVTLARRPVLFALARTLAEAFPADATREALIQQAFGAARVNASHRARLRVEMARLRQALAGLSEIEATARGFMLLPRTAREVALLLPLVDGEHAAVSALLADGRAWSSSSVALALGVSQRSVQRALLVLQAQGKLRALGKARAQRWLSTEFSGFAPSLLLPSWADSS